MPGRMIRGFTDIFSGSTLALIGAVCAVGLAGCEPIKRDPQVVATPDKVSLMMAEAADKASNALETLAAVEQNKSPGVAVQPIHNAPPELQRAVTVNWVGPPEQVTKTLAERASYSFIAVGNRPPVPPIVNIDVEGEPVIDVLRDVGLQLGVRGDIKVDSVRKIIELHYAPVTGLGG